MKEALERTIQTLIDSGGDDWSYNSMDINTLVNWIEEQQKQVKNIKYNAVLAVVIEDREIERVACEEVQNEDCDSIAIKNTFLDGFEKGAKWYKEELNNR